MLAVFLLAPAAYSADISGLWKSGKGPVWIEVNLSDGKGIIVRHEKFPERVGQVMLTALVADDSKQNLWHGKIYLHKRQEFREVDVTLPEANRMVTTGKMGFLSKSAEWLRVEKASVR